MLSNLKLKDCQEGIDAFTSKRHPKWSHANDEVSAQAYVNTSGQYRCYTCSMQLWLPCFVIQYVKLGYPDDEILPALACVCVQKYRAVGKHWLVDR